MATADLRFEDKNEQKKSYQVFASGVVASAADLDALLFNLPEASLVTDAYVVVLTQSGTAGDTVDIKVGSTVIANEVDIGTAAGTIHPTIAPTYFATGGAVTAVAGSDAPDDAGEIIVVIEYIETTLTNGQWTH